MYKHFYHLKKEPFHITPDPEFLFLSPSHKQALGSIVYGVKNRKGFIVITGEVGVGKTTILRSYLEGVAKQKTKIIYIFNADLSFKNLLETIFKELGLDAKSDDVVGMLNNLYSILMEEYQQDNTVLLIVDEAQNMPVETLENIRMLSNLETSKDKLIQIVLVGQPEFEKVLNLHQLRQLKQRIAIRSTIIPFTRRESIAYIKYRLTKAAANENPVFTPRAMGKIVKEAAGIPRNLNILCDNALITGFGYKKSPVDTKIVEEVVADMKRGEKYSFSKTSLPDWAFVTLMLLILASGLVMFSPYKGIFSLKIRDPVLSRTADISLGKISIEPPAAEEAKGSPQSPALPSRQEPIKPLQKKEVSRILKEAFPLTRVVKKGDTLFGLTRKVYGHADNDLLAWVKKNNPGIKDISRIPVGATIIFPENPLKKVKDDETMRK